MATVWRCAGCATSNSAADGACVVCRQRRAATPAPAGPAPAVPAVRRSETYSAPMAPLPGPHQQGVEAHPGVDGTIAGSRRRSSAGVALGIVALVLAAAGGAYVVGKGSSASPSTQSAPSTSAEDDMTIDSTTVEDEDSDVSPEAETDEATTSIMASGLVRREALGNTVLVPAEWVETIDAPGGSSSTVTYQDPSSPSRLVVQLNGCVGCVDEGMMTGDEMSGVPYPEGQVPGDATSEVKLSPLAIAYARPAPMSGYAVDGIVRVTTYQGSPEGSVVLEVTLPISEHDTASEILNYT